MCSDFSSNQRLDSSFVSCVHSLLLVCSLSLSLSLSLSSMIIKAEYDDYISFVSEHISVIIASDYLTYALTSAATSVQHYQSNQLIIKVITTKDICSAQAFEAVDYRLIDWVELYAPHHLHRHLGLLIIG